MGCPSEGCEEIAISPDGNSAVWAAKHVLWMAPVAGGGSVLFWIFLLLALAGAAFVARRSLLLATVGAASLMLPPLLSLVDASALDRGHYGNVASVRTILRKDSVSLLLETTADPELEPEVGPDERGWGS